MYLFIFDKTTRSYFIVTYTKRERKKKRAIYIIFNVKDIYLFLVKRHIRILFATYTKERKERKGKREIYRF